MGTRFTQGASEAFLASATDIPSSREWAPGVPRQPMVILLAKNNRAPHLNYLWAWGFPVVAALIKFGITMCKAQSGFCLLCRVTCLSQHPVRAAVNPLTLGLTGRWPGGPTKFLLAPLLPGRGERELLFAKCFSSRRTFSVLRVFCHHKSEAGEDYDRQVVTRLFPPADHGESLGAGLMKPLFLRTKPFPLNYSLSLNNTPEQTQFEYLI